MSEIKPPPAPPAVGDIPQATALHVQLSTLLVAIEMLGMGGVVTSLTVSSPPTGMVPMSMMPAPVTLNPPITDPVTLDQLATALSAQATTIAAQLETMGYSVAAVQPILNRQRG